MFSGLLRASPSRLASSRAGREWLSPTDTFIGMFDLRRLRARAQGLRALRHHRDPHCCCGAQATGGHKTPETRGALPGNSAMNRGPTSPRCDLAWMVHPLPVPLAYIDPGKAPPSSSRFCPVMNPACCEPGRLLPRRTPLPFRSGLRGSPLALGCNILKAFAFILGHALRRAAQAIRNRTGPAGYC